jgi:hypothetical protein
LHRLAGCQRDDRQLRQVHHWQNSVKPLPFLRKTDWVEVLGQIEFPIMGAGNSNQMPLLFVDRPVGSIPEDFVKNLLPVGRTAVGRALRSAEESSSPNGC